MAKYIYDEAHQIFNIEDALTISKGVWADGNPNNRARMNRFVTSSGDGNKVALAGANDYICGVTISDPTFLGSDNDKLHCVVQSLGLCIVEDKNTLAVGDKCMPTTDGLAKKSANDLGYRVVSRIDSSHVQIIISPNNDMIQRIKKDMELTQKKITSGTAEPSGGSNGDIYIQY